MGKREVEQEDSGTLEECTDLVHDPKISRRSWCRYNIRHLLAATGLAVLGVNRLRMSRAERPAKMWRMVQVMRSASIRSGRGYSGSFCDVIFDFNEALRDSNVSLLDVTTEEEYEATMADCVEVILRNMDSGDPFYMSLGTLELHTLLEYGFLSENLRQDAQTRMKEIVRRRFPEHLKSLHRNGKISPFDALECAKILRHADLSIDDIFPDASGVRAEMRGVAMDNFRKAHEDQLKGYRVLELCDDLDATMSLDLRSVMSPHDRKIQAEKEISDGADSIKMMVNTANMMGGVPSVGEISMRLDAIRKVASYGGIDPMDPAYVEAWTKATNHAKRLLPSSIFRRLERGK